MRDFSKVVLAFVFQGRPGLHEVHERMLKVLAIGEEFREVLFSDAFFLFDLLFYQSGPAVRRLVGKTRTGTECSCFQFVFEAVEWTADCSMLVSSFVQGWNRMPDLSFLGYRHVCLRGLSFTQEAMVFVGDDGCSSAPGLANPLDKADLISRKCLREKVWEMLDDAAQIVKDIVPSKDFQEHSVDEGHGLKKTWPNGSIPCSWMTYCRKNGLLPASRGKPCLFIKEALEWDGFSGALCLLGPMPEDFSRPLLFLMADKGPCYTEMDLSFVEHLVQQNVPLSLKFLEAFAAARI